jgi:enterochelin esterase-like enzyme
MAVPRPQSLAPQIPDYISPEIIADRRVTLRYFHPTATKVWCEAEWNDWSTTMFQRSNDGIWSCTSQPIAPDIYEYNLFADGARILDPQNPATKNRFTSLAHVPAPEPALWEPRDVPRGTVHVHQYGAPNGGTHFITHNSSLITSPRRFHIYTPPGYETETTRRYPVLYLLHGAGDDDEGWTRVGRLNLILDNLLAENRIRPMIVVMPNGHVWGGNNWKEDRARKVDAFHVDFFENIIPLTERLYHVEGSREMRAIAGLSMGGGQTIATGFTRPDLFGAYGLFSSGLWPEVTPHLDKAIPSLRENPPKTIWIGIGRRDFLFGHCTALRSRLEAAGVPFTYYEDDTGHSWRTWRDYLIRFAPLLFPQP